MVEIARTVIEGVLAPYKPEQQFLIEANIDYPVVEGNFLVGPCYYSSDPSNVDHVADSEIQLCLNQLIYVGLAERVR